MSGYEREYGSADEDLSDEDLIERERERERRRRAMSPAVAGGARRRNQGDEEEDDEVVPVDRGEQLVKRRARERKVSKYGQSPSLAQTLTLCESIRRSVVKRTSTLLVSSNNNNVEFPRSSRLPVPIKPLSLINSKTTSNILRSTIRHSLTTTRLESVKFQDRLPVLERETLRMLAPNALKLTPSSAMVHPLSEEEEELLLAVPKLTGRRCLSRSLPKEVDLLSEDEDRAMYRVRVSATPRPLLQLSAEKTKRGV
jgi:hypothetical protein